MIHMELSMIKRILASAALAAVATVAMASVTFDPATGTGFVGKGDVQTAFGFNNATMQAKATATTFSLQAIEVYSAVCTFTTGDGTPGERTHNVAHVKSSSVNATVAADPRRTGQWTGWYLTGFGAVTTAGGEVPVVGAPCPGNQGHDGVWTSVELTLSQSGGLYATIDGVSKLIWSGS